MAVTRLERKGKKNKIRAKVRQQRIKELTTLPPVKNVDVEKIKAEFAEKSGKKNTTKKAAQKKEEVAPAEEAKVEQPDTQQASEDSQEEGSGKE